MSHVNLPRHTNQALGIGQYAIDFMRSGEPSAAVLARTTLFHTDAVICGLSALALGTNAPTLLREEALSYRDRDGATEVLLGMIAADREWNEGAAKAKLLQMFEAVGLEDPWVAAQRRRLSLILFG